MLFNSFSFAIFLPIVFFLYWFVFHKKLTHQNRLLLLASYFFYACWDWRFLFLLLFSTGLDYVTGIKIEKNKNNTKRFWFWLSIIVNLGFLGVFKYYNFFADSFADALSIIGIKANFVTLNIILPVGISFYTFHGLSYIIDIYNGRIKSERNFIDYAVFVSFFPLLVAGPIERATHLLPQIKEKRKFKYSNAADGCRQILWGLFKKIVIADNCAVLVNDIFSNYQVYQGSTLALGAVLFAIQIYGDFSGYTDIAIGTAKLFGINLLKNFAYPYFSRDIAEFWRRWHISLSTWFRDYLYIPLGGSKAGKWKTIRNVFIIFIVSGFWHGANWTFIVWGMLNAMFIMPSIILKTNRNNINTIAEDSRFPSIKEVLMLSSTFILTCFAWIFFRAENLEHAWGYVSNLFSKSILAFKGEEFLNSQISIYSLLSLIILFFVAEWLGRKNQHTLQIIHVHIPRILRWGVYYAIVFTIIYFHGEPQEFIYFQF